MKRLTPLILLALSILPFEGHCKPADIIVKKPIKTASGNRPEKIVLPEIKPVPFKAPQIKEFVTPKGIKAWLVEDSSSPLIAVSILFKGGAAADPERLTGLSELAVSLLDEGAGNLRAGEFQEKAAAKAIKMSFSADSDTISASMTAPAKYAADAFGLLRLALTKPRFDNDAVRRVKEQMYAVIDSRKGRPEARVRERWNKLVFSGHPYSRVLPAKEGVKAVGRPNLKRFVKTRFAKDNMIVSVTGNMTQQALIPLLDGAFGGLPEKAAVRNVAPFVPELKDGVDILTMDVPQSATIFGHRGIARNDPDFYPALLVMHILGSGGFSSRLFNAVREEKGLTYDVGAVLSVREASPAIVGWASSENAKLAEAISLIRREWEKMARDGPAPEELNDAKTFLTGSFPLTFASNADLATFMSGLQLHGLPRDYFERRNDLINAVTLENAKETAGRILRPESLFFVVVGKPANL